MTEDEFDRDGFVKFDDLTELEQRWRAMLLDKRKDERGLTRWQKLCKETLKQWSKSPAGLLALQRYKRTDWTK